MIVVYQKYYLLVPDVHTHPIPHAAQSIQRSEVQPEEHISFLPLQECLLPFTQTQTFPSIVG